MSRIENMEILGADRLLRKKEAAELLACSVRTLDRLADAGRLTRVNCGGVKFRESEVRAIINGENNDK